MLDSTLLARWLPPEDSELDCRDMHKERLAEEGWPELRACRARGRKFVNAKLWALAVGWRPKGGPATPRAGRVLPPLDSHLIRTRVHARKGAGPQGGLQGKRHSVRKPRPHQLKSGAQERSIDRFNARLRWENRPPDGAVARPLAPACRRPGALFQPRKWSSEMPRVVEKTGIGKRRMRLTSSKGRRRCERCT